MGNFSPIHKILDAALSLDLANPNFSISEKEAKLRDSAIMLGSLDYYRLFPMRIMYITTYNSMGAGNTSFNWMGTSPVKKDDGMMYIPFEDFYTLGEPKVPAEQMEHVYFLGIGRISRPEWATFSNPSKWETAMFGFPVSGTYQFDITSQLVSNTYDELSTGQPMYTIDRMQNRVNITSPWGLGQLSIFAYIGFDNPEYVEHDKVDYLCKFVSYRFIEAIIQARSGIELDADFKISVEALKERLQRLKEEIDDLRKIVPLSTAQWG